LGEYELIFCLFEISHVPATTEKIMTPEFEQRRKSFIKRFPKNVLGRDFFVGDLHGCFHLLSIALRMVDFDPAKDRLFVVGDLVDRGQESDQCLEWMAKPWFHSVQGNHEDMAIWCALGGREGYLDLAKYVEYGGGWFVGLTDAEKQEYAYSFLNLPYLIEIETDEGPVGIVHADSLNDSWDFTVKKFETVENDQELEALRQHAIWSRYRINNRIARPVSGVRAVIVGHTPVREPVALCNTFYIDTGAVFGRALTIIELSDLIDIPQMAPRQR
jgi:serine/threonine protein phosphatase 1